MTAPATQQTARVGVETAAPIFIIGDHDDADVGRDIATRRRQTAGVNDTQNPTRAVTNAGLTRPRGVTRGTGGGGGGAGYATAPAETATMARVEEMKAKKDEDVVELYLAEENLEDTPLIIEKFFNLAYLWLNNNLLTRMTPLTKNCHLTEVYLHNNRLTTISGVFKRLFCLQTLFLHNNQLRNLDETISELQPLKALQILNLFHNPLAQEERYREKVISSLRQVSVLDRQDVEDGEKHKSDWIFKPNQMKAIHQVAFGSRGWEAPPPQYVRGVPANKRRQKDSVADNFLKFPKIEPASSSLEERQKKHGTSSFTRFDWSKVMTSQEKRNCDPKEHNPKHKIGLISTTFK